MGFDVEDIVALLKLRDYSSDSSKNTRALSHNKAFVFRSDLADKDNTLAVLNEDMTAKYAVIEDLQNMLSSAREVLAITYVECHTLNVICGSISITYLFSHILGPSRHTCSIWRIALVFFRLC